MSNTLFPPIVESYQPVFVGNTATIYFTKPNFFNETNYTIEYKVLTVDNNTEVISGTQSNSSNNYIKITYSNFALNTYYKVNLRFKVEEEVGGETVVKTSKWSTTTYIRRIAPISVEEGSVTINLHKISGKLKFDNALETETFKSYSIKVNNGIEEESGVMNFLTKTSPAPFEYVFTKTYKSNCKIEIFYETTNGYKGSIDLGDTVAGQEISYSSDGDGNAIRVFSEPDSGYNSLIISELKLDTGPEFNTNCYIRRAKYTTNYTVWETLIKISLPDAQTYYWQDLTSESGVFYKYQLVSTSANKYYTSPQVVLNLDTIYLSDKDNYLAIAFNPTVDSMKYVTTEAITNTIGSKYPFVRRNAETKYRQFSLGGLISFMADYNDNSSSWDDSIGIGRYDSEIFGTGIFISEDGYDLNFADKKPTFIKDSDPFATVKKYYDQYKYDRGIQNHEDFLLEKIYRDKVMEFLTNGEPKLFRSGPEGNILVQLTAVTFKPEKGLGRGVYSFSATATEIADFTYKNCLKYNLVSSTGPVTLEIDGGGDS